MLQSLTGRHTSIQFDKNSRYRRGDGSESCPLRYAKAPCVETLTDVQCSRDAPESETLTGGTDDDSSISEGKDMRKQARNQENPKLSESDAAPSQPIGPVSGELVTETFEYDGGRQVTVYVPPNPPEAIVFAGDGQRISKWGRLLAKADVPSTMIVGVHGLTDETLRLHEYSPGGRTLGPPIHRIEFLRDQRQRATFAYTTCISIHPSLNRISTA
jgi:hypothetical protein